MNKAARDMRYDVSVIGLYILDVLAGRYPHSDRGNVDFIEKSASPSPAPPAARG